MRRWVILALTALVLCVPVGAMSVEAPAAPESVADLVPEKADSFGQGLWNVVVACVRQLHPALTQAGRVCLKALAVVLLCGWLTGLSDGGAGRAVGLAGVVGVTVLLLEPSRVLIQQGVETIQSLSEYGKLLLPVMTGALAAQGGGGTAAALYSACALFDSVLSSAISGLLVPLLYLFLGLSIGFAATGQALLGKARELLKWLMQWTLKIALYLFTGFLTVTGVVSGSADAAAIKAAKLTISGVVPVVGGILSDASEAVLVGAGVVRGSVGVYGLLTFAALFLSPFVKMGAQYLLLKAAGGVCASFSKEGAGGLVQDFSTAMGLVLGAAATQTVLLMVSTVCLMKGVG